MTREEARKLLGGYATGTLSAEEQQALFEAALDDQELFDELAREQSLRDLLADPVVRSSLVAVLDEPRPKPWYARGWVVASLAAAVPALALLFVLATRPAPPVTTVAKLESAPPGPSLPSPAGQQAPPAAPPPVPRESKRIAPPTPTPSVRETLADKADAGIRLNKAEAAAEERPNVAPLAAPERGAVGGALPAPRTRIGSQMVSSAPAAAPSAQALFFNSFRQDVQSAQDQSKQAEPSQAAPVQQQLRMATTSGAVQAFVPVNLGVGYTVMRRDTGGEFVPVSELEPGDTAAIRLVPNARGHLTVTASGSGTQREVLSVDTAPMASYTTAPLRPGESQVSVVFARQPQAVLDRVSTQNLVETAPNQTTYVVNVQSNPPPGEVAFTITLKYK